MPDQPLISIVDDDRPFRDSLRRLVKSFGYLVEAFPSAGDFLASPHVGRTDCLIADINMPEMTGVELYGHLLGAGNPIPTILITAYPDEAARRRALNDGVVCYLTKPCEADDLAQALRLALEAGASRRHSNPRVKNPNETDA